MSLDPRPLTPLPLPDLLQASVVPGSFAYWVRE
jgi:hypothetical protein